MTPMKECKACRKMISTDAEICPNCGKKDPTSYTPEEERKANAQQTARSYVGTAIAFFVVLIVSYLTGC